MENIIKLRLTLVYVLWNSVINLSLRLSWNRHDHHSLMIYKTEWNSTLACFCGIFINISLIRISQSDYSLNIICVEKTTCKNWNRIVLTKFNTIHIVYGNVVLFIYTSFYEKKIQINNQKFDILQNDFKNPNNNCWYNVVSS